MVRVRSYDPISNNDVQPLAITAYALVNALGDGHRASLDALRNGRSGLTPWQSDSDPLTTWYGLVDGLDEPIVGELAPYDCRNNRLARRAIHCDGFAERVDKARQHWGAERIGVFVGTSTAGILTTETAYRSRQGSELPDFRFRETHNIYSVADYTRQELKLAGPAQAVSTACSSSAKVFAAARRFIDAGLCDAAVVGGVDSLCYSTLYGFNSLELISADPCRPWDVERNGISLGEAGGFALLERDSDSAVRLAGYGESSDAYHMSTPHPEGAGALAAMTDALQRAHLDPAAIDYINLHGTATPANDRAEDCAVSRLFGNQVSCSSTKGWTGHTLGAAGITEAIFTLLALENAFLPATLNCRQLDPALNLNVLQTPREASLRYAMSNSFGFGGNNCSLIFERRAG